MAQAEETLGPLLRAEAAIAEAEEKENARREAEEAEARARAEAEEKARREAEVAEARAIAEAEEKARLEAEEAEARARADAEAQARREAEEAEARARVEAEEKARREAEEAEARAVAEAEEKACRETEEAEARAIAEAEEKARKEAEEAEAKARVEAEEQARREAEEAEARAIAEAEEKARREAEDLAQDLAPSDDEDLAQDLAPSDDEAAKEKLRDHLIVASARGELERDLEVLHPRAQAPGTLRPDIIRSLALQTAGAPVLLLATSADCSSPAPETPQRKRPQASPNQIRARATTPERPARRPVTPGRGGNPASPQTPGRGAAPCGGAGWTPRTQEQIVKERRMDAGALADRLYGDSQIKQEKLKNQLEQAQAETSFLNKLKKSAAQPQSAIEAHVNSLLMWQKQKTERCQARMKQQEEDLQEEAPFSPKVCSRSRQISHQIRPVWERTGMECSAKHSKDSQKRIANQEEAMAEATFRPAITRRAQGLVSRVMARQEAWEQRRKDKIAAQRASRLQEEFQECTFHPDLLSTKGPGSPSTGQAHARLHQDAVRRQADRLWAGSAAPSSAAPTPRSAPTPGGSASPTPRSATPPPGGLQPWVPTSSSASESHRSKSPTSRRRPSAASALSSSSAAPRAPGGRPPSAASGIGSSVARGAPGAAAPDSADLAELKLDELLLEIDAEVAADVAASRPCSSGPARRVRLAPRPSQYGRIKAIVPSRVLRDCRSARSAVDVEGNDGNYEALFKYLPVQ